MEWWQDSIGKLWLSSLISIVCIGCAASDGLDRQPVSGDVTLDGAPLPDGTILFEPLSPDVGTAVGGNIRRGHFDLDRTRGPVPGQYRVRIYARSTVQADPRPGSSPNKPRPLVEKIPEIYNLHSTLTARVLHESTNLMRYDLSTNPPRP